MLLRSTLRGCAPRRHVVRALRVAGEDGGAQRGLLGARGELPPWQGAPQGAALAHHALLRTGDLRPQSAVSPPYRPVVALHAVAAEVTPLYFKVTCYATGCEWG